MNSGFYKLVEISPKANFDETLEAIDKIDVVATFSTAVSTASSLIPQNLINVEI